MKSKELKVYNLPNNQQAIARIDAKPIGLFFVIFVIGLLSFLTNISFIYSLSLIVIPLICYLFMPSVILLEFYDTYLVLHNKADKSTCVLIYYEDVESWYYTWSPTSDQLVIELADGSTEKIKAFSKPIFESHMNRVLRSKHKKNK